MSGVLRNQTTATRTGKGEESEKKYTANFRKTPPPQAAATVYYPMTDDEGGELSAVVRPGPLVEGRPQGKLERHAGIGYEIVQNFDVPVPQMMEQLPNIVQSRLSQCRRSCGTAGGSADENLLSNDPGVSRAYGAADRGAER